MTVLLLQAPNRAERTYPLQLAYMASALKAAGYKVRGLDLSLGAGAVDQGLDELVRAASAVVLCTSTVGPPAFQRDWPLLLKLVRHLREQTAEPLIVTGTLPTLFSQRCAADPAIDYAVRGDPEPVLPRLLQALADGGSHIPPGVFWTDEHGIPVHSEHSHVEPELDSYPPPDYSIVDLKSYRGPLLLKEGLSAPVLTSRGCTHNCAPCCVPALSRGRVRRHTVQRAVAELERLTRDFGVDQALVEDDDFAGDPAWVEAFCAELSQRRLGLSWQCLNGLRISSLNPHLIGHMARAGCSHLALGIETFNSQHAQAMGRPYHSADLDRILRACADHRVRVTGYFLVDYPRLQWSEVLATALRARSRSEILLAHFSIISTADGQSTSTGPLADLQSRLAQVSSYALFYIQAGRLYSLSRAGCFRPSRLGKISSKLWRLMGDGPG